MPTDATAAKPAGSIYVSVMFDPRAEAQRRIIQELRSR